MVCGLHSHMFAPTFIPALRHTRQTSGCIKGPPFSLPVVFVALFAITMMES